ncbi:hypothetical protein [Yersinia enterocolitica]|uniref:hypothetical protein n=1 Tax=Yersinia enterocolitica TaxID=630 RepID=UPI000A404121|nr:hypothetical protein [Yersinia enterocolitica]
MMSHIIVVNDKEIYYDSKYQISNVKYQIQFSNNTLTSYTKPWATAHGDIKDTKAEGYSKEFGRFFGE